MPDVPVAIFGTTIVRQVFLDRRSVEGGAILTPSQYKPARQSL